MSNRKRSSNKKTSSIWRNILAAILLLIAIALIFNTSIRNMIIAWNSNRYQVSKVTEADIEKNKQATTTFDFDQVESISTEAVLKAQWEAQELPVIGGIAIPDLKVNLPIFKGLSNVALMYGAGTMKETQEMGQGNYSLASHHIFGIAGASETLFSPLEKAKEGTKIYLTDKQTVYTYVVTSVQSLTPESVYVIDDVEGQTEVTLVTCEDLEATMRTVVKGTLESSIPYNEAPKDILKHFEQKYNQVQL
ncbi:class A sortase [Streptococcus acidominimus]|uniref:Sortase n=1 Tax=Streptococcus acidominimus TaxID=1326 RepID=A0A1Q8EFZ1_STRAI|nr:class A sortase [Streptococcus acidominimus]MBF0849255.1 class A sortase [Streptococcus danieliae]MBF0818841.1 class A sortase [Streptococcus acidominimus]MBF0839591.1 class A sortase [Streptococcus acidominimus]OLF50730.1 class A sortase [Streptococcus acidominimus]TFU30683.1 class A sortase [Streptococcus acidominimus]